MSHLLPHPGVSAQPRSWAAVTPADTDMAKVARILYIKADGNLVVRGVDDSTNTDFGAVKAGAWIPGIFKRVAASTTATVIAGF